MPAQRVGIPTKQDLWGIGRGSNPQQSDSQSEALPIELPTPSVAENVVIETNGEHPHAPLSRRAAILLRSFSITNKNSLSSHYSTGDRPLRMYRQKTEYI